MPCAEMMHMKRCKQDWAQVVLRLDTANVPSKHNAILSGFQTFPFQSPMVFPLCRPQALSSRPGWEAPHGVPQFQFCKPCGTRSRLTHLSRTHGGTRGGPAAASQGLQCTVLASNFQLPDMACARHLPFGAAANNIHSGALGQLMAEHASCPEQFSGTWTSGQVPNVIIKRWERKAGTQNGHADYTLSITTWSLGRASWAWATRKDCL